MTDAVNPLPFRTERAFDPGNQEMVDRLVGPPAFGAQGAGESDADYATLCRHARAIAAVVVANPALGDALSALLNRAHAVGGAEVLAALPGVTPDTAIVAEIVEPVVPPRPAPPRHVVDVDRVCRMRREGYLLMHDAGGSAHDPALLARTLDNLNTACIGVHAGEALTAAIGSIDALAEARLVTDPASHQVFASTIVVVASLYTVAQDGTKAMHPVFVTISDTADPMCTPLIEPIGGEASPYAATRSSAV